MGFPGLLPIDIHLEGVAPLREPVLLIALAGYFDAAGVASTALDHLAVDDTIATVAIIDPDPFYDFTVERPLVEIVDDGVGDEQHTIVWPANHVKCLRTDHRRGRHDLVVLNGVEPHLHWPTYIRCITTMIDRLGIGMVITLGAAVDTTPHTRMPLVVGSTGDAQLAQRFALSSPSYEGVTGVIGVLHTELAARAIPSISLRVGVPHYLASGEHPRAVLSLVQHVAHLVEVPFRLDLAESIEFWDEQHSAAIVDDDQLRTYVRMLEVEYDRRAEAALAGADELAARFEQFLRDQPPDES